VANPTGGQTCTICSSPIVAQINAALDAGEKLRPLAEKSGFSKASLSRHNRRCRYKVAIAQHRAGQYNPRTDFVWLEWPGGQPGLQHVPDNFSGEIPKQPGADDLTIRVSFEPAPPARVIEIHSDPCQQSPESPSD
jgi:hypothetical protein